MLNLTQWIRTGSAFIVATCLLSMQFIAFAAPLTYPEPTYVSDYAHVLTPEQIKALTDKVLTFKQETSNEIAVLVVPTTAPETIEEYSIHVTDKWKIGKKGKDNGVLFTVAVNDRAMRLEIGRGLEGAIPDISTVKILNTYARPRFRENDYYQGISDTLDIVMAAAKGEFNTAEIADTSNVTDSSSQNDGLFTVLFYGAVAVFGIFTKYMAKTKSWWLGGVVGGGGAFAVSLLLSFGLFVAFFLAFIFGLFGLIIDFIVSKNYKKNGDSDGGWWWGGGSGGGWSGGSSGGSSFGGGGFSGGGGSSSW